VIIKPAEHLSQLVLGHEAQSAIVHDVGVTHDLPSAEGTLLLLHEVHLFGLAVVSHPEQSVIPLQPQALESALRI
jgi:hypothetical protein